MNKHLLTLWIIALFLLTEAAYATMPPHSEKPQSISPSTCQKWAATQDDDVIEMWGIQEDGSSSSALAIQRLTSGCLGQPAPEIVGFGSSAGFDDSYCQKHSEQKICSNQEPSQSEETASPTDALAQEIPDFIVNGEKIVSTTNDRAFVTVGERAPMAVLKQRFRGYKIIATSGEDCAVCAFIRAKNLEIAIYWDESGLVVESIVAAGTGVADPFGNRMGGSLRDATTSSARCDSGMDLTCENPRMSGLSYMVDTAETCDLMVVENGDTHIPACAKISAFIILRGN